MQLLNYASKHAASGAYHNQALHQEQTSAAITTGLQGEPSQQLLQIPTDGSSRRCLFICGSNSSQLVSNRQWQPSMVCTARAAVTGHTGWHGILQKCSCLGWQESSMGATMHMPASSQARQSCSCPLACSTQHPTNSTPAVPYRGLLQKLSDTEYPQPVQCPATLLKTYMMLTVSPGYMPAAGVVHRVDTSHSSTHWYTIHST
jgi:hypothetical protein